MCQLREARVGKDCWLPINFLCESNSKKIILKFGKIIFPFDDIQNCVDLSCIKLGISISHRKNINAEIPVEIGGKFVMICIVEFENTFSFYVESNLMSPMLKQDQMWCKERKIQS